MRFFDRLLRGVHLRPKDYWTCNKCGSFVEGLATVCSCGQDLMANFTHTPTLAPTHTDMMVDPESLDAFMKANPLPTESLEDVLDMIRADGWVVACHNDYRQNGQDRTFWLFTRNKHCVKGEGLTDYEALLNVQNAIADLEN